MTAQTEGSLEVVAITRSFLPTTQFGMAVETVAVVAPLQVLKFGMDLIPDMALPAPPAAS